MKYNISKHNAERVIYLPGAEVAAKYRGGATLAEISAEYNVSQPTIAKALDAEGVSLRSEPALHPVERWRVNSASIRQRSSGLKTEQDGAINE